MVTVEAVKFGFFTDEEVKKHSFVKVTNPIFLNNVNLPISGGLYDPAMGPMDDNTLCKTCGMRAYHCPGHCGHIELVAPIYNPLLFDVLHNILQNVCFYCNHFRASTAQVELCASKLNLIRNNDIIGAKRLQFSEEKDIGEISSIDLKGDTQQNNLTSLQLTQAISVLGNFFRKKSNGCRKCEENSDNKKKAQPKITKPTFGWFHKVSSSADVRSNVIRAANLEGPLSRKQKGEQVYDEYTKQKKLLSGPLLPSEVKDILKLLWENEVQLCSYITDIMRDQFSLNKDGYTVFFLETILVPPIKFRPPSKGDDSVMEHPQTVLLGKVLLSNIALGNAHVNQMDHTNIVTRWMELQQSINVLFDSKKSTGQKEVESGIIQLLEKKEGIFRQKMMGKRVNFACRSVISPDPYLAVNEIGIPPYFALRLTYPEKVTTWNANEMRNAVINGPVIHPGATHYIDKSGTTLLHRDKKARVSAARKLQSSKGVVTQHRKNSDSDFEGKTVLRHVRDGDIVLVNRQPTLHKPSIMAHVVRVLKGEKTLRMHYANCSTYNADFDGDEMNVHLPQDEISRAEAYNIVNANNQYIIPTRGEPLRGLIQDHIVSAVLLTMKDTFLSRFQFNQLLYSSGVSFSKPVAFIPKPGQKVYVVSSEDDIVIPLPAILKPEPLWTGKQVITAVLCHITSGHPPFTLEKEGKLPRSYFAGAVKGKKEKNTSDEKKGSPGEETLYIFKNYLVRGVIDKAQFGKYGLVHTVHELYGPSAAGNLLSALSRLFTVFLQIHGFTCGVDDLLLLENQDNKRKEKLEKCHNAAKLAHHQMAQVKVGQIAVEELQTRIEKAIRGKGDSAVARLDSLMRSELTTLTNDVNKELFPNGLQKSFPKNCFSLMTSTGAKGSDVNFHQVSSLLGQQELEGKRVPRMVSGKTLPCFQPWDMTSRAGGYITDNFLNGLRPQEYYFHCMAGREGLVDTAVKTSRSGYLQRCLVKNLECLKVSYDHTVRDLDGSIVQFTYGEDGLDVLKTGYIDRFDSLEQNHEYYKEKVNPQQEKVNGCITKLPLSLEAKAHKFFKDSLEKRKKIINTKKHDDFFNEKDFMKLVEHKYFSSLTQPGEPVGVVAAQSVGEPSTQMTLNTFHHAGRGEMNVTLGIPRLQEILMTASSDIKTPIMTCPLLKGKSMEDAKALAANLKKVTLADIIKSIKVSITESGGFVRTYKLKMKLYDFSLHPPNPHLSPKHCRKILRTTFIRVLEDAIQNHIALLSRISGIKNFVPEASSMALNEAFDPDDESREKTQKGEATDNDDDGNDDDDDNDDLGSDAQKRKQKATDEIEYEDEDNVSENADDGVIENNETKSSMNYDDDDADDDETEKHDGEDGISEITQHDENVRYDKDDSEDGMSENSKPKSPAAKKTKKTAGKVKKNVKDKTITRDTDRAIFVSVEKLSFEAHFKFTNEPHVMLDQIAQKAAKKVHLNNSGKIEHCTVCDCSGSQVIYYGDDPKKREPVSYSDLKSFPALQTAGLDFITFWKMEDDLDMRYIYSNNIHAMLNTYGVEAARETLAREVKNVFGSYGVTVDFRHLTLIADYMTHSGGYRPMSRNGGILDSISPFTKITFETAAKFIKEAAYHGLSDNLEAPSARICLGLPVKLGTGCFDLMQTIEF